MCRYKFRSNQSLGPSNGDRAWGWRETSYVVTGQTLIVHYEIQADEGHLPDKIVNKRSLTSGLHISYGLVESSIAFSVKQRTDLRNS